MAPDAFAALAGLARAVRDRSSARVVAITGSVGKTSTKDILAALCRPHARTVASEGGHNNEIGLPLTLLAIEPDSEVVIAEMGMRGLGQIAELCALARPHIGVITSVGPAHLGLLGTVERVAEAKSEVIQALPAGGTGIVPTEPALLDPFIARDDIELVRFGERAEAADVRLLSFEPPRFVADVQAERVELEVPFAARHQARNMLAALAAYRALGLPLERVGEGVPEIRFSRWRGEEIALPDGTVVINDAYNANPDSMKAALTYLRTRAAGRRAVAVLGEMAELGEHAVPYHREIGRFANDVRVDALFAVGELAAHYVEEATQIPLTRWFDELDAAALVDAVRDELLPGDVVLVKASRAVGLEVVAEALAGVTA